MTDFFDWLTASDSGLGADRLREQFRLSQQEMRRTTEALAPAFLFSLQRLVADPAAWTDFMRRVATLGPDQAAPGLQAASPAFGSAMLGKLFGTDVLADSVARHASLMAGVAPDTIRKMMPDLALMTVQTMMRMAAAQSGLGQPSSLPSDQGGQALAEIMRRSANAVEAFSRPASTPQRSPSGPSHPTYLESLFADALKGGFPWMMPPQGSGQHGEPPRPRADTAHVQDGTTAAALPPFFAFAPLFEAFGRPNSGRPADGAARTDGGAPPAPPETGPNPPDPLAGMAQLLEAGRSMQETYALEMLALFDRHRSAKE